jgi:hypothetical protein
MHSSFCEACDARGLLASDDQRMRCMREAATFQMPAQMRQLFAAILAYDKPKDPLPLWDAFKEALAEDYLHEARKVTAPAPLLPNVAPAMHLMPCCCRASALLLLPGCLHLPALLPERPAAHL